MNKYYFINKFDTNIINKQDKQTIIIYRNYSSKKIDEKTILDYATNYVLRIQSNN